MFKSSKKMVSNESAFTKRSNWFSSM
jgi:hypothetical protein